MQIDSTASGVVTREYERSQTKPSSAVLYTLAEIKNDNLNNFETPLPRIVDVGSLDCLLTENETVSISFIYEGYEISINNSEVVIQISDGQQLSAESKPSIQK